MNQRFLIFSIFPLFLLGCFSSKKSGNSNSKIKLADELFTQEYYWDAARYYQEAYDSDTGNVHLTHKLAESYYFSRDYKNAETYYGLVITKSDMLYPIDRIKYSECKKRNGNYAGAKVELEAILKMYRKLPSMTSSFESDKEFKKMVDTEIKGCDLADELIISPLNVIIENPKSVNAAYTDMSPFIVNDTMLIFASLNSDSFIVADEQKKYFFRLYRSHLDPNGKPLDKELLPPVINAAGANAANGCFSPDMKYFYYTLCKENDKGITVCAIYRNAFENGLWGKPEKLPETINTPDYTATHPTIGKGKGQRQVLYFVSDRPQGSGGRDIWYSVINEKGDFSEIQNLGKKINTSRDELTPFYDNETNTLFFSSDGHPGIGGYDIFQSEGSQRKWSDPVNIGYPLNSSVDDMYYMTDSKGRGGFIVSNRKGSLSLKNETCCDDIFWFQWKKGWPPKIAVDGYVYDEADSTKMHLEDFNVRLYLIDKDSTEFVVEDAKTLKDILFFFKINFSKNYRIYASKEGYFPGEVKITTIGIETSDTLHVEIPVKKLEMNRSLVLKDIFYDFDKATLRPESKNTLERLLELFYENPSIIVELSSNTDSKGDDDYNLKLSQKRAESVVKYLLKAGIQKERLVAKGYGETTPIASNTNPDGSDSPEGRQLNRRTEIKVVGKLNANLIKEQPKIEEIMERE